MEQSYGAGSMVCEIENIVKQVGHLTKSKVPPSRTKESPSHKKLHRQVQTNSKSTKSKNALLLSFQ